MNNYYEELGIDITASDADIKRAYQRKARATHPDRNQDDPDATAKFQAIQRAYSVLSDPDKRAAYDRGEPTEQPALSPEEQIEQQAQMQLLLLFDQTISQLAHTLDTSNIVVVMLDSLRAGRAQLKRDRRAALAQLKKYRTVQRRLKTDNWMLIDHIRGKRLTLINSVKSLRTTARINRRINDLVSEMQYEVPKANGSYAATLRTIDSILQTANNTQWRNM